MRSLYVIEPGAWLKRSGEALHIVKDGAVIREIPSKGLERLLLSGYVSLTGGVLDFLIKNRIETVFITPTGRFRARLMLDEHKHVALRKAQYAVLADTGRSLKTAALFVRGKIVNMADFLSARGRQYRDGELKNACARLKPLASVCQNAENHDAIRGFEGAASAIYYGVFGRLIRNKRFRFTGRNRRPPLDPVNAMLSYVYTLLTNEVLSAVKTCGLDPYLGALHEISYGRPSLACDLVEEYRAWLGDRFVLGLINRRLVSPDDFVYRHPQQKAFIDETELKQQRPVEMKPEICRALISAYEEMMKRNVFYARLGKRVTYRRLILHQAESCAAYFIDQRESYAPFAWVG